MNSAPSDIVAKILIGASLAEIPGQGVVWPVYVGRLPADVDTGLQISDASPDSQEGFDMRSKERIIQHGVQIIIRVDRASYGRGMVKTGKVQRHLETVHTQTISIVDYDDSDTIRNYNIAHIQCPTGALYIGAGEDDERHHFSINAFLTAKEV